MKKLKQLIKKLVMWTLTLAVVVGAAYGAYWYNTQENTVTYQAPEVEAVEVVQDHDVTKAAKMLAEATAKLNEQEEKLLAQKLQIETEAARQVAEIEKEIEAINQIRSSF